MNTIDVMKRAASELRHVQRSLFRYPGLGFNVQPSAITELDEAIEREEAQTVEPAPSTPIPPGIYYVTPSGKYIPHHCAKPVVKQPLPAEREALIEAHRCVAMQLGNDRYIRDIARATADMLASDAQPEKFCCCNDDVSLQSVGGGGAPEGYLGKVTLRIGDQYRDYYTHPGDVAQQVAVPQGWRLVPVEPTLGMIEAYDRTDPEDHWVLLPDSEDGTTRRTRDGDASIYYRALLAAAPQPPQAERVPMTDEDLPDEWPNEFSDWYQNLLDQTPSQIWPIWSTWKNGAKP